MWNVSPTSSISSYDSENGPGLVAGIARRGEVLLRRGAGLSSVESGAKNTVRTRMRVGSTTKQFTCLSILLLAQDGLLSIDDDIRKFVPELPPYPGTITLAHMMSNTSGLRCYLDLLGVLAGANRSLPASASMRLQGNQHSTNFPAGERLVYCNGGYLLLSTLIERVAEMPLAAFMSTRSFEPIGMTQTALEADDTTLLPGVATLHQRRSEGGPYYRGTLGIPITGDGAIISCVDDMLRWLAHMDSPVVGNAQTWSTLLSAGKETPHGYGFGLMHRTYRGVPTIEHGGTVFGGRCQLLKVPEHGIDIIIMSNASDVRPAEVAERALDILLEGVLGAPRVAAGAASLQNYTGTYYSADTAEAITVVAKAGHGFIDGESGDRPLYEAADGAYCTNEASLGLEFAAASRDASGVVTALDVKQGGCEDRFVRVDANDGSADASALCGTYENGDSEAAATVTNGDALRITITSPYGGAVYGLEHLHGNAWVARIQDSWMPLKVIVEAGADSFAMTSGRTKRFEFVRNGKVGPSVPRGPSTGSG